MQLSGRVGLRDIGSNFLAQTHKLYYLACGPVSRSSLGWLNARQPYSLYASKIDLSLSIFPWATYQKTQGASKLHVASDHEGYLPAYVDLTEGNVHEIGWARALKLPQGGITVCDRGFTDNKCFNRLNTKGILFVTRLKQRAPSKVLTRDEVNHSRGLTPGQTTGADEVRVKSLWDSGGFDALRERRFLP